MISAAKLGQIAHEAAPHRSDPHRPKSAVSPQSTSKSKLFLAADNDALHNKS
jgi:hypothetical protein